MTQEKNRSTDTNLIMTLTVDISLREIDVQNYKARVEEVTKNLKNKNDEYAVRQEEQAFQDQIDALWKQADQFSKAQWAAFDNWN